MATIENLFVPYDIIRMIHGHILEKDPLYIFEFNELMFKLGGYEDKEKQKLIIECISRAYYDINEFYTPILHRYNSYYLRYYKKAFPSQLLYILSCIEIKGDVSRMLFNKDILNNYDSDDETVAKWFWEKGLLPLELWGFYFCRTNNLKMLDIVNEKSPINKEGYLWMIKSCEYNQHLEVLKWLKSLHL
jgi:hypothetical protein